MSRGPRGPMGRMAPIRTTERRTNPCGSCRHFETGDAARNHYVARRDARIRQLPPLIRLKDQGKENAENARFRVFDVLLAKGGMGICLLGKSESDFCHASFGCDSWEGVPGAQRVV